MNFLDLIILGVIGLSTLLAFSRGFIKEMLSILGWIGAVIATVAFFARRSLSFSRFSFS